MSGWAILTPDGARCPHCGREFSVWTTRRFSGWSTAHHAARTRNLVRANAHRHEAACPDRPTQERPTADPTT